MTWTLALVATTVASLSIATRALQFWQDDLTPRRYVRIDERGMFRFAGNTTHPDHFRLLEKDGMSMLIGARNIIYNISLSDLSEHRAERLEWEAAERKVQMCSLKGLNEEACHNYIRVLAKTSDRELYVCGTNAYEPACRTYTRKPGAAVYTYTEGTEKDGRGICPYDPNHNSTAVFVDGQLYAATVADFASSDPLIYRHPLRTEKFELKQLNAPDFVGSMDYGDFVYFFFRETAVEYINCGKRVYSRVARVCKKDRGGPYRYTNKWTSFLKARLNCSIPGEYPFYFDEIQSVSAIQGGMYGGKSEDLLYTVFTTPPNSIPGSAVCAFRMKDVMRTFSGAFKHQEDLNSNWLSLSPSQVPSPRPGQCVNDSRSLPDVHLNFIRSHPLMDEAVPSVFGSPLLVRTSLRHRFTQIAVDPQVRTPDGAVYDVLFIATDDGRVLKVVNAAAGASPLRAEPVLVEELELFPAGASVRSLLVTRSGPGSEPRLVAVSDAELRSVPLQRCGDKALRCAGCVRLQDPYCGWEPAGQRCAPVSSPAWPSGVPVIQNVSHGVHPDCPQGEDREPKILFQEATTPSTTTSTTAAPEPSSCNCSRPGPPLPAAGQLDGVAVDRYDTVESVQKVLDIVENSKSYPSDQTQEPRPSTAVSAEAAVYTAETLAVAVVTTCLLAMVIGFLAGWVFSRRYWRMRGEPYYETPHLERQSKLKHLEAAAQLKPDNRCDRNFTNTDTTFLGNNGKQINLVVNQTRNNTGKNANSAADNKPLQKVRKMYL